MSSNLKTKLLSMYCLSIGPQKETAKKSLLKKFPGIDLEYECISRGLIRNASRTNEHANRQRNAEEARKKARNEINRLAKIKANEIERIRKEAKNKANSKRERETEPPKTTNSRTNGASSSKQKENIRNFFESTTKKIKTVQTEMKNFYKTVNAFENIKNDLNKVNLTHLSTSNDEPQNMNSNNGNKNESQNMNWEPSNNSQESY